MLESDEEKKNSLSARGKVFIFSAGVLAITNFFGINLGYVSYILWIIIIALTFYKIVDLIS